MTPTDVFPAKYFPNATRTRVTSLNEAKDFLNNRLAQLATTIKNLLDMAEHAVDRGDVVAARGLLATAQPYIAARDRMTRR